MAAKQLEQFRLEETSTGYLITVSAEGGQSLSVEASPEQLDAIIDALDDLLGQEELDEIDDDDLDEED